MVMAVGSWGCTAASSPASWAAGSRGLAKGGRRRRREGGEFSGQVRCVASSPSCSAAASGLTDQYRTLRIQPDASEKEVKRAFRQLALQYHPDVCKGSNCGVQFHRINEAYDIVINNLRGRSEEESLGWSCEDGFGSDDEMRGMYDSCWDMWEEWMGWEGAGIRDYSSHINPYL